MQIAAVLLALLVGALPALPAARTTSATVARLEVTITTTADWAVVDISPGSIAAQRVLSLPADVTLTPRPRGWALASPAGQQRIVRIRAVFEEPSRAARIRLSVSKGAVGRVSVDIRNTSRSSFVAARALNPTLGVIRTSGKLTAVVRRTRYQFFGAANPVLSRTDPERHVLAFYYPWFTPASYDDPKLSDRPLDRLGTVAPAAVLALTRMARGAGISGFIVSWAGADQNGKGLDNVLSAAEQTNGVATALIETPYANSNGDPSQPTDPVRVERWVREAVARADRPAFLRSGGVPVLFVYRMSLLESSVWQGILDRLAADGHPVRLVGDAQLRRYGTVEWGQYRYDVGSLEGLGGWNRTASYTAKLLRTDDPTGPHLFAATVSPGYDDRNLRGDTYPVYERGENGERYLATWNEALAVQPDWILATSWNEWFEATAVQPSERFGDLALRQTTANAARFRS